jgi:hypothetical protein
MTSEKELLAEIRAGAKALGIAPTTLCQRAVKNQHIVGRLIDGKTVTMDTARRIRAYIAKHRPNLEAAE